MVDPLQRIRSRCRSLGVLLLFLPAATACSGDGGPTGPASIQIDGTYVGGSRLAYRSSTDESGEFTAHVSTEGNNISGDFVGEFDAWTFQGTQAGEPGTYDIALTHFAALGGAQYEGIFEGTLRARATSRTGVVQTIDGTFSRLDEGEPVVPNGIPVNYLHVDFVAMRSAP